MKSYLIFLGIIVIFFIGCAPSESTLIEEEIKTIENGLIKAIEVKGDSNKTFSIEERLKYHKVPGVSIAVVRNGKIRWAKGYGIANTNDSSPVNTNTLFQAGSISKPVAALAALKLAEENRIDLDADVNNYLKDWKIKENKFTKNEKVTLRRLLTHTAGITVHGFPGYQQTDTFPTIIDVLNGDGNTAAVSVDTPPDSVWRYSGGGFTLMEKVVEDVSGVPLEKYMEKHFFQPMQMTNSTYEQPLAEMFLAQASAAYDYEGNIIEGLWHNYPEQAAAGLWTTPTDLAKYCIEVQEILAGKSKAVLKQETIEKMLTKHKRDWGLGPSLKWEGDSLRFQHGGKNAGFTCNMIAFAHKGDAVIVMTNADNGRRIIGEIERAISKFYDLGIAYSKEIELADSGTYEIEPFLGKYLYTEQIPGIGDYYVDLIQDGENIILVDLNNNEENVMYALDSLNFIDIDSGDEMEFVLSQDTVGFNWNKRHTFYKVE